MTLQRTLPATLLAALPAALLAACDTWDGDDEPGGDDDTAAGDDDTAADDDDTAADDDDTAGAIPGQSVAPTGRGASARWAFEDAFDNVDGGDWYRDSDNESATLAWGESYVMMALAAMFRATGDPAYLDRLAWHADGVLARRDDARGVTDYRGVSGACWRNLSYQPADEPYCYVVHSGMIGYPIVEFARLVAEAGLEDERGADGIPFGDKAAAYVAALEQTVAYHDDQWDEAGTYLFRSDATFLGYPGVDLPLNQSNAMGRLLLALADVTGDAAYRDRAAALARRFADQLASDAGGAYLWNYWGGAYSSPGEDISHAAINVDFALMAARRGVVFDDADLAAFAATFVDGVYQDDETFSDCVGGGGTNGGSYRPQAGRWLRLTPERNAVYTAVRQLYEADYPASSISSGSTLLAWAYLAEFEPVWCDHFFYQADWDDPDPHGGGDWNQATAYGANVLTVPPDLDERCMIPLPVDAPRATTVQQYDGAAYHDVARWSATGGEVTRLVPYEPRWPHVYWNDGVLFQFVDAFVAGDGIRVQESPGFDPPHIDSPPPQEALVGEPLSFTATGSGAEPRWWSLTTFPTGARIDPASGQLSWTPEVAGEHAFVVELRNDAGADELAFTVDVR